MDGCLSDAELDAIILGAASSDETIRWLAHTSSCAACAAHLAELKTHLGKHGESLLLPLDQGLEPGAQMGDFLVEKRLRAGGMGIVFEARQVSLNRRVALKVLAPGLGMTDSAIQRFHREARAAAQLHHTNIVAIYSEGEHGGICFYAMELIEGEGLDQVIDRLRCKRTPGDSSSAGSTDTEFFDAVALWAADAADALDYAHQQGVIHRDVKPSNLMLDRDNRIKLMDFGLARMLEEPGMTLTGEFLGTPRYMSPEQIAAGRIPVDHRTDVYSLGATLYELLTLEPPFSGKHRDEVLAKIVTREPRRPRQLNRKVPVDLETICLKAIEKDPEKRYQTAGAFAADLRRYVNRFAIAAKRIGPVGRVFKFARRHKLAVTASAAILLLAAAAGGVTLKWLALQRAAEAARHEWQARTRYAEGRYAGALTEIDAALDVSPGLLDARLLRSRVLLEQERLGDAEAELTQLLERDLDKDHRAAVHYLLARVLQGRNPNLAEHHRLVAQQLLPESCNAYYLRATVAGTPEEAVRLLTAGLTLDPRHFPSLKARALENYTLKRYARMERDAAAAILLRGQDASGYALRAMARRELGQLADAVKDHDQAVHLLPDDLEIRDQRRATYHRMHNHKAELADALKCVELSHGALIYRFHYLTALLAARRYDAAEAEYRSIAHADAGSKARLDAWLRKYVLDAFESGEEPELPAVASPGSMLEVLQTASEFRNGLHAKARRLVARGFRASWSPDGKRLAYGRALPIWLSDTRTVPVTQSRGIEILDLESGVTRLLVTAGKDPSWSPDGKYIAFVREPWIDAYHEEEVWIVPAEGGEQQLLARGGFPSWARDSQRVFFHSRADNWVYSIRIDDPEAPPRRIVESPSWYPSVSPDERLVAYGVLSELRVVDIASGSLVAGWQAPGQEPGMLVNWSPDGTEICIGGFNRSRLGLWVFELKTQSAWMLSDGPATAGAWSPDRSRLAFDLRWPLVEIWVADLKSNMPTAKSLGAARSKQEYYQSRLAEYSREIQKDPDNAAVYFERGRARASARNYPGAVADFTEAIERDPENIDLYRWRAEAHASLGDDRKALADYDQVVEHHPEDAESRHLRGHVYERLGEWKAAVSDFSQVLERTPNDAHLLQVRAQAYLRLDEIEKAASDYHAYGKLLMGGSPSAGECDDLAWLYLFGPPEIRDPARARPLAEKATELAPEESRFVFTLGVACYRLGQYKEAIDDFHRGIDLRTGGSTAAYSFLLAMSEQKLHRPEQARAHYDEAIEWWYERRPLSPADEEIFTDLEREAQAVLGAGAIRQFRPDRRLLFDGFDGALEPGWEIRGHDPTHVSFTARPGSLTITTQISDFHHASSNAKNLFLLKNPAIGGGDFEVTTCLVSFEPVAVWNQAGLVCFDDEDNYLKWVYQADAPFPTFNLLLEIGGKSTQHRRAQPSAPPRLWLRVTRMGDLYLGSVSTDGKTFQVVAGCRWDNPHPTYIGLIAENGMPSNAPEIEASFDFLEIRSGTWSR